MLAHGAMKVKIPEWFMPPGSQLGAALGSQCTCHTKQKTKPLDNHLKL
jgi:hypothetical protein